MRELLKERNFVLLWSGQAVSGWGSWVNYVGLNLYVYALSGSGRVLGTFLLVRMLPAILFGPVGGYFADRYSRRHIMIGCDLLRALLVLAFLWTTNIAVFFVLGLVLSAVDKVFLAANSALLPDLVPRERLLAANSLTKMTQSVINILGPTSGALLVSVTSYRAVFLVNALSFLGSVLTLLLIRPATAGAPVAARSTARQELLATLRFLGGSTLLLFLVAVRFVDALGSGAYLTALPIFGKTAAFGSNAAYGWLVGAWACGEFTGALLVGRYPPRVPFAREALFGLAVIVMAVGFGLTFHCATLALALGAICVGGLGDGVSSVLFNTALMEEPPDEVRGKVMGTTIAVLHTALGSGMAVAGVSIDAWTLRATTDVASTFIGGSVILGCVFYVQRARSRRKAALPPQ